MAIIPSRWLRHVVPMVNAIDVLQAMKHFPVTTSDELGCDRPFLVLSPHPDDETLGCGGLIATASAQSVYGHVCIVTDGSASHPALTPQIVRAMREAETRAAMAVLGLPSEQLFFLNVRDTAVPRRGSAFKYLLECLTDHIRAHSIKTLFAPWEHDPHPDHRAVARLAHRLSERTGTRLFFYPVWGLTLTHKSWLPRSELSGYRLDISAWLDRKREAIACHASQMTTSTNSSETNFTMPAGVRLLFEQDFETFVNAQNTRRS